MRRHPWTAAAVVVALVCGGCSADKPEATTPKDSANAKTTPAKRTPEGPPQAFLSERDIAQYPAGSPERAVFTFWFRIQYRDLLSAYESLTPEFRKAYAGSLKSFGEHIMADYARWLTKPRLLFVNASGDQATVALSYPTRGGVQERSSFTLRRSPTGWAVAYDFYLINRLTAQ